MSPDARLVPALLLLAGTCAAQEPATSPTQPVQQSVNVTTTRSGVDMGPTANTTSTLSVDDLTQYPALTLDERLRQHAGFELFRRSSSWVANPTSEGISLRGLGSTAASRTLVLSDSVPLNDPFGGWIHWNEMPPETVEAITLASGGGSDLYGSSALGGVIDVIPARPGPLLGDADLAAGSEDTTDDSARGDLQHGRWDALAAGQSFRTDGYTIVAPSIRGAVDVPSNVHFQNGRLVLSRSLPRSGRAYLMGNVLNEAHGNGTPLQTNGTRLWRYAAGDDWTAGPRVSGRVRGFGSDEAYRQSFSSITPTRSSESLTRLQRVETQEFGASADASAHLSHIAAVAGGDLRDTRATDFETPYTAGAPNGVQDVSARQRFFGGFGELVAEHGGWSGAGSLRVDEAANLATQTVARATATAPQTTTPISDRHELVFSPRLGLVRTLPRGFALHAAGFRAFRTPTMNELYRTGQVGQQTTLANSALLSERATGAEGGLNWSLPSKRAAVQATYFWTEINRPVSTVLLSSTATTQTLKRENLGQIQSQGVELAAQLHPLRSLSINLGYQYAHAVVTAFAAQTPPLVGLWIPQVPRHSTTAQARYRRGPAAFTLAARESGHAFDDSSNLYELHSFFVLDAYAESRVGRHLTAYVSAQNLLNRSIETARTPNLTLGTPFTALGGLRLRWGGQ
ncbi:Outer membrane receptor proteins, mostly Fe transport [Granulicella rosea]|uniref:Outer membrane receptor proteins, mostly Fe transport n=1 Tax=Granulicella rosea TaxID=474952 RepID=A0A239KTP0_9BACT|nr:TonB-dependent receptor [Granulicella rosea]SNT21038.1 Outer membrane receptor proteins, mostly Fe transport [Granulicella rosea]